MPRFLDFNEKLDQIPEEVDDDAPERLHTKVHSIQQISEEHGEGNSATETFANTQEERDLVRKLDSRILPITCLLYLFACEYGPSGF